MNPITEESGVYHAYLLRLWRVQYQGQTNGAPAWKARTPASANPSPAWSSALPFFANDAAVSQWICRRREKS